MKRQSICVLAPFALVLLLAGLLPCRAADVPPSSGAAARPVSPLNYTVRVDWRSTKGETNSLQLVTTEGTFKLQTSLPGAAKGSDSEWPISVSVDGELQTLNSQQGRLRFFLGRSVPVVVRAGGASGNPSMQQRQEGLTSNFLVTFGKPLLIQKDANTEVTVVVEREKP